MNIDSLTLFGFRGITNLSLNFHKQITVIVGNNGAGKSTILDALAILLSWVVARIRISGSSGRNIQELDIQYNEILSSLVIKTNVGEWGLIKVKKGFSIGKRHTNNKTLNETFNEIQTELTEKSFLKIVSDYAKTIREIIGTNGECSIPLFVYYPINRAVLVSSQIKSVGVKRSIMQIMSEKTGASNEKIYGNVEQRRKRRTVKDNHVRKTSISTSDKCVDIA